MGLFNLPLTAVYSSFIFLKRCLALLSFELSVLVWEISCSDTVKSFMASLTTPSDASTSNFLLALRVTTPLPSLCSFWSTSVNFLLRRELLRKFNSCCLEHWGNTSPPESSNGAEDFPSERECNPSCLFEYSGFLTGLWKYFVITEVQLSRDVPIQFREVEVSALIDLYSSRICLVWGYTFISFCLDPTFLSLIVSLSESLESLRNNLNSSLLFSCCLSSSQFIATISTFSDGVFRFFGTDILFLEYVRTASLSFGQTFTPQDSSLSSFLSCFSFLQEDMRFNVEFWITSLDILSSELKLFLVLTFLLFPRRILKSSFLSDSSSAAPSNWGMSPPKNDPIQVSIIPSMSYWEGLGGKIKDAFFIYSISGCSL